MTRISSSQRRRPCAIIAPPGDHLFVAEFLHDFVARASLQSAIVAFIQQPAGVDDSVAARERFEHPLQGVLRPPEQRGVEMLKVEPGGGECQASRAGLLTAFVTQTDISPAGKAFGVALIRLAVPHERQY